MNFPVNPHKATHAVARLLDQSGGPVDYLRIIKLIYLSDRESLKRRGVPIVGGKYFSMRKGPVNGDVMDFVGDRTAPEWKHLISPRFGNEIRLQSKPDCRSLSPSEIQILDDVVHQHSGLTTDELVAWCHKNCDEYEEVSGRERKPIEVETVLLAVGKGAKAIRATVREAKSLEKMDALFS